MNESIDGLWIPIEVLLDKKLTLGEKLFLCEIKLLDKDKGCFASNGHFSNLFNVSKGRCTQIIKSLEKKGYIKIKIIRDGKTIKQRVIKISTLPSKTKYPYLVFDGTLPSKTKYPYLENAQGRIQELEYNLDIDKEKIFLNETNQCQGFLSTVVEWWNKRELVSKNRIKPFNQLPKVNIVTKDIQEVFREVYNQYGEDGIRLGINNYCHDIESRAIKEGYDYHNHRFDLYSFLSKNNGLLKFINK